VPSLAQAYDVAVAPGLDSALARVLDDRVRAGALLDHRLSAAA
jgi:hypothetical protein